MVYLANALLAGLLAVGALWLRQADSPLQSRKNAIGLAVVLSVLSALFTGVDTVLSADVFHSAHVVWMPEGYPHLIALGLMLIMLATVALAPLATHSQHSFACIAGLFACAQAFFMSDWLWVYAVCWGFSAVLVWRELYRWHAHAGLVVTAPAHGGLAVTAPSASGHSALFGLYRLFGWYQGSAFVLFLLACASAKVGWESLSLTLLVLAIVIRAGIAPFQSWLTPFVEKAPIGIVIGFCIPQLGFFTQFVVPALHENALSAHVMAGFGAVTAIYAALLGLVQTRGRRTLAYLFLSQSGLLLFGLASENTVGFQGAIISWYALSFSLSGLALILCALEARRGHVNVREPNGNFSNTPKMAIAFLVLGFASVGFPLTAGFVGEDLLVQGNIQTFPILGIVISIATAFNGFTVMRLFFYLFAGRKRPAKEPDLFQREYWAAAVLIVPLIVFGLQPHWLSSSLLTYAPHIHIL